MGSSLLQKRNARAVMRIHGGKVPRDIYLQIRDCPSEKHAVKKYREIKGITLTESEKTLEDIGEDIKKLGGINKEWVDKKKEKVK